MEAARRLMERHGWVPGSGLGKESNGITRPIVATLKNDKLGVGAGKQSFTPWWERAYNQAASGSSTDTSTATTTATETAPACTVPSAYSGSFVRPKQPDPDESLYDLSRYKPVATSVSTFEAFNHRTCKRAHQTGKLSRLLLQEKNYTVSQAQRNELDSDTTQQEIPSEKNLSCPEEPQTPTQETPNQCTQDKSSEEPPHPPLLEVNQANETQSNAQHTHNNQQAPTRSKGTTPHSKEIHVQLHDRNRKRKGRGKPSFLVSCVSILNE
ncbi:hypothetical protein Pelo_10828 [Pelomyxa schiedti]|nr:hypothetical protein Pelo_10828 [Pelomyxa schiedti]